GHWKVEDLRNTYRDDATEFTEQSKVFTSQLELALAPVMEDGAHLDSIDIPLVNNQISASNLAAVFHLAISRCTPSRHCVITIPFTTQMRAVDQIRRIQKLNNDLVTVYPLELVWHKRVRFSPESNALAVVPEMPSDMDQTNGDFLSTMAVLQTAAVISQFVMLHPDETPANVKKAVHEHIAQNGILTFPMTRNMPHPQTATVTSAMNTPPPMSPIFASSDGPETRPGHESPQTGTGTSLTPHSDAHAHLGHTDLEGSQHLVPIHPPHRIDVWSLLTPEPRDPPTQASGPDGFFSGGGPGRPH
ncbi:hypothetical protein H0H93_009744, partial [Arthromyces matolae]